MVNLTRFANLNRSLGRLTEHATGDERLAMVAIADIIEDPDNARQTYDADTLRELADSMEKHGLKQAIGLYELSTGKYQIVWGHRRFRAGKLLGWKDIKSVITTDKEPLTRAIAQLLENIQRDELTPIELANFLKRLLTDHPNEFPNAAALAGEIKKHKSYVSRHLALLDAPEDVQQLVNEGKLGVESALSLAKEPAAERTVATQAIAGGAPVTQHVSRKAEIAAGPVRAAKRLPKDADVRKVHELAAALGLPTPSVKASADGVVLTVALSMKQLRELLARHTEIN